MIFINEWLPNPKGNDTEGEWVELFNSGPNTNLSGWKLKTGKQSFTFGNVVLKEGNYLLLPRSLTRLSLRNTDETLLLLDARGVTRSTSEFYSAALEGKSFSLNGERYSFGEPTPGAENKFTSLFYEQTPAAGTVLAASALPSLAGAALGTALALSVAIVFLIKRYENSPQSFSG